jgi:adenylate cyclase
MDEAVGAKGAKGSNGAEGENQLRFREIDLVIVKGKKEPKKIFELIVDDSTDVLEQALEQFHLGRAEYTKGNWDAAMLAFQKAIDLNNDGPSHLFLERCEKLKAHPPEDWKGVYVFESK